ncbi:MAG: DUF2461 domain-containing protein [Clostridia bacterium]|nr:DUF2461 domain-containing protein [Clostridia bacterium]
MFKGFTNRTDEFFMAIRFNNNAQFFHENHDWYDEAVRQPLKALAADLGPAVELLDPTLERRPERAVSRINRDIRFSNDKSPYRDYMWIGFHRPRPERSGTLGVYFDISAEGSSYGMGIYDENRPLMNGLRRQLASDARPFLEAARPALAEFALYGRSFKRMKIPPSVPEEARAWYPLRGFWVEKDLSRAQISSHALVEEITRGIELFTPLYRYIAGIEPVDDLGAI